VAAWVISAASAASQTRIAITGIKVGATGVAVTWRAAASGRYVIWVGGTYCGGGVRVADGAYRAPAPRTVVVRADDVPPSARMRVCVRTAAGVLTDAVATPAEPGGHHRALVLVIGAIAVATAVGFVSITLVGFVGFVLDTLFPGRRRTNFRGGAATTTARAIDAGNGAGVALRLQLLPFGSGSRGDAGETKGRAMPQNGDVHVLPADEGWRVEVEGSGRAHSTHPTQAAAAKAAREVARENKSKLFVHARNGEIRKRKTYGDKPDRSKG
jgi:hypothetical protein